MRKSTSDLCSLCSVTSLCSLGVGVRAVELLPADLVSHGSDLEASTLLVVEDGRKYARRVEARQAQPVDRPVRSHEGRGVQVPDDPVVLYRLVGHSALDHSLYLVSQRRTILPITDPLPSSSCARATSSSGIRSEMMGLIFPCRSSSSRALKSSRYHAGLNLLSHWML